MFLAPLFLVGLLATAIPLVLHLRRSTRHKRIVFSTTRFFDEQFIRSSRRAQVQDKLLMLLRIALLALFVLALAQPLVRFRGLASWTGERRSIAIVIDDSASMGMMTDKGTLLERAKAGAITLLHDLSYNRGDKVTVVLAGRRESGPRVLIPDPTSNFDAVRGVIAGIKVADLGTDLTAAIDRAGRVLSGAGTTTVAPGSTVPVSASGSREVYVFSDMQESAFPPGLKVSAGPGTLLVLVSTKADPAQVQENLSADAVQYGAPQPMLGVPFTFRALLTNHAEHPRTVAASLVIEGQTVAQKSLEIPASRSQVVRFTHRFTKTGWFGGYVDIAPGTPAPAPGSVPGPSATSQDASSKSQISNPKSPIPPSAPGGTDALAFDNHRYFAVHVEEKLRILAIDGAPSAVPVNDELFFLRLALTINPEASPISTGGSSGSTHGATPPNPIQLDQATPAQITPDRLKNYPLVVVANVAQLSPDALEALERYTDAGGNVLITLGDRVDPRAYAGWIGENRLHGGLLPGRLGNLIGDAHPTSISTDAAATQPGADAGFIASVSDDHPVLAGFSDGQLGSLSSVRFAARYDIDAPPDSVLMRSPTGQPILAEKRFGRGRVLLFASSINRSWTNFPLQPVFVPWIYRVVSYLAQGGLEGSGFVRTGQVVPLPTAATQVEALQVECPDGSIVYPQPAGVSSSGATESAAGGTKATGVAAGGGGGGASGGANQMVVDSIEQAGVYRVRAGVRKDDSPRMLFAANVPSDESDPVCLDSTNIAQLIDSDTPCDFVNGPESVVDVGAAARRGYGLWDQLLFAALLVGLFEPWFANRLSKRRAMQVPDVLRQRDTGTPTRPAAARPAA